MPNKIPVYYWDTCIWISWLLNESRSNNEMDGVIEVIEKIEKKQVIVITSDLIAVELLPCKFPQEAMNQFDKIFSKRNVQKKGVDNRIFGIAQNIRNWRSSLTVPDAVHLATAIHYQADQFHTFDEDDLLPLDGNVAGHALRICKPTAVQYRLQGF